MKTTFSCTLNAIILGGRLREVAYTNPLLPLLKIYFTPIKGEHGPLCPLAMPVTVVQPEVVNGGHSEGAKRPSGGGERVCVCGGEGGGGVPTVGRLKKKKKNRVWKLQFLHIKYVSIRGWLSEVAYTNPYFPFILLHSRGRGMGPCAP